MVSSAQSFSGMLFLVCFFQQPLQQFLLHDRVVEGCHHGAIGEEFVVFDDGPVHHNVRFHVVPVKHHPVLCLDGRTTLLDASQSKPLAEFVWSYVAHCG